LNSYKHSQQNFDVAFSFEKVSWFSLRIYNLSKKASEDFMKTITSLVRSSEIDGFPKVKDLKIAELDDPTLAIIFDDQLKLYVGRRNNESYFPLLKDEQILPALANTMVDMGAVKFVCNGANVMRPGIVSFSGDFKKGDLLLIKEVSHSKAIAVGRALEDKTPAETMKKGPTIQNLHYVGDKLWEALKLLDT
jgi:PUA domain protein